MKSVYISLKTRDIKTPANIVKWFAVMARYKELLSNRLKGVSQHSEGLALA